MTPEPDKPGPAGGSDRIMADSAVMAAGRLVARAGSFVTTLVTARVLGPAGLGTVRTVTLVGGYLEYSHLGLLHALNREVPLLRGNSDDDGAEAVREVVLAGLVLTTLLTAAVATGAYLLGATLGGLLTPVLFLLLLGNLFVGRAVSYTSILLSAEGEFSAQARAVAVSGVVSPLVGIPLVLWLRVPGALLIPVVIGLIQLEVTRRAFSLPARLRFDRRAMSRLVRTGMALFLAHFAYDSTERLELTLIAVMLTRTDVGIYGFVLAAFDLAALLPNAMLPVVQRRMALGLGRQRFAGRAVFDDFFGSRLRGYLLASTLSTTLVTFLYIGLIRMFLPSFEPGIPVLIILAAGNVFFRLGVYCVQYLGVAQSLRPILGLQLGILALNIVLDVVLLRTWGIRGAAAGSALTYAVYALASLLLVGRTAGTGNRGPLEIFRRCVTEFAAFAILFAGFGMLAFTVGTDALAHPGGIPLDVLALVGGTTGLIAGGLAVHHLLAPGDHVVATVTAEIRRWRLARREMRRPT